MPRTAANTAMLDRYLPDFAHGNHTSVEVAAAPHVVWAALHALHLSECRTTSMLMGLRALPGRLRRRGAFGRATPEATSITVPVLQSMTRDRFVTLDHTPGREMVVGVIGQFWKVDGGTDVPIRAATDFVAFHEPGFVKVAANFRVEATATGSTLSTETRCAATDPVTARTFALYWALVGWGSKLIRWDMLAAVRRRAEADTRDSG